MLKKVFEAMFNYWNAKEIAQRVIIEQNNLANCYCYWVYCIFNILYNGNIQGIIKPLEVAEVALPLEIMTTRNFAFHLNLANNYSVVQSSANIGTAIRSGIIRGLARDFGVSPSDINKYYNIKVVGDNLLISAKF